jgi:hypothetical protein
MLLTLLQTITYYSNLRYFALPLGHFVQSLVSKATSLRGAKPAFLSLGYPPPSTVGQYTRVVGQQPGPASPFACVCGSGAGG